MLQHENLLTKIGVDTAENGRTFVSFHNAWATSGKWSSALLANGELELSRLIAVHFEGDSTTRLMSFLSAEVHQNFICLLSFLSFSRFAYTSRRPSNDLRGQYPKTNPKLRWRWRCTISISEKALQAGSSRRPTPAWFFCFGFSTSSSSVLLKFRPYIRI